MKHLFCLKAPKTTEKPLKPVENPKVYRKTLRFPPKNSKKLFLRVWIAKLILNCQPNCMTFIYCDNKVVINIML